MRKACQADLVGKPLIIKGIMGNKSPITPVTRTSRPMFSMAWPSENISAVRPMSEGASPELSTGSLFFYLLFFYFRAC
jgi:hypothetical protein